MKTKLILAFIVSVVFGFNSLAQDKKVKGKKESIIDHKTELGSSDQQVEQIKAIQKEYIPKIKEARNLEDRATLRKLNQERKAKIEQLLTSDQLEKWKAIREKIKKDSEDN